MKDKPLIKINAFFDWFSGDEDQQSTYDTFKEVWLADCEVDYRDDYKCIEEFYKSSRADVYAIDFGGLSGAIGSSPENLVQHIVNNISRMMEERDNSFFLFLIEFTYQHYLEYCAKEFELDLSKPNVAVIEYYSNQEDPIGKMRVWLGLDRKF